MLGTIQDSEDAVQETWLRWARVDLGQVRDPRSYLLRSVTRTALNIARTQRRRREAYPGPWLPEPVSTATSDRPDGAAETADEVSLALLVVLGSLSPSERAAFVLREVFDVPYPEVARTLDRSEASVRQLVSRARARVRERAPRRPVDSGAHRALIDRFLAVARGTAPLTDLVAALAQDVVLTTDGGGRAKAALRPVVGVEKVLRFVAAVLATSEDAGVEWSVDELNGAPALVGQRGARVETAVWIQGDGDVVTRVDVVRNPGKLGAVRPRGPSAP